MNEPTLSRRVTVINEQGLHLRPLDMFVKCAGQFDAKIEVVKDAERADGKSILSVLTLVAEAGSELLIEATGHDAEEALAALVALVESGFVVEDSADARPANTEVTDTTRADTEQGG
jgi:phosphotransferase system HPr (HPr) family protein